MPSCDVLVIGGGPAGATCALALARRGIKVIVLEKSQFPRFHIGESFIPRNFELIHQLGLGEALGRIPHVAKFGATFVNGDDRDFIRFDFDSGFVNGSETFNIERAPFDHMLLTEAKKAGADVRENLGVKRIVQLSDGDVRVAADDGEEYRARWLVDASGQATVVARHLGTRKTAEEPYLQKSAYFNHFKDVDRAAGREGGHPLIAMMDEGWFWMIPIDPNRTGVGLVLDAQLARNVCREQNMTADRMLAWGIARCPAVRNRMKNASGPATNGVTADFSYRCRPCAGEGYFLIGDAAAFLDPIFSTGVCLAMYQAVHLAEQIGAVLSGQKSADAARTAHVTFVDCCTTPLFKVIRQYYDPAFRELFLSGRGPFSVHRAVIGVLAGNVFPRPPWEIRWRLALFGLFIQIHRWLPLVSRKPHFSIMSSEPRPLPWLDGKAEQSSAVADRDRRCGI
ncbi:MAG TPA: NAD(P)/FAD-dependent oxidoreductase [Tepidisphaeraceae bacterium]|nr:NAD(P)/FAD-dependent oxidoreductase [Tepidisphaeraceae bacterium]